MPGAVQASVADSNKLTMATPNHGFQRSAIVTGAARGMYVLIAPTIYCGSLTLMQGTSHRAPTGSRWVRRVYQ